MSLIASDYLLIYSAAVSLAITAWCIKTLVGLVVSILAGENGFFRPMALVAGCAAFYFVWVVFARLSAVGTSLGMVAVVTQASIAVSLTGMLGGFVWLDLYIASKRKSYERQKANAAQPPERHGY